MQAVTNNSLSIVRFSIIFGVLTLIGGCNRPSASPWDRLEQESPVRTKEVILREMRYNGGSMEVAPDSLRIAAGASFELEGVLAPGEWGLTGLITTWRPRDGEPRTITSPSIKPGDRPGMVVMLIHGDDLSSKAGVVQQEFLEVRSQIGTPTNYEFRLRSQAPKKKGTYVMDVQFIDQTAPRPRGQVVQKPAGFPIWRRELIVF